MRSFILLAALLAPLAQVQAQTVARPAHPPAKPAKPGPRSIGKFDDWQAATHTEGGQPVCYAFTRAQSSTPAVPGRGDVVLTVTMRQSGRDAVALSAGFAYPAGAEVQVQVGTEQMAFYTAARSAFAREGRATTASFERARSAVARSPGPKGAAVTDNFSLRGFGAAYAAIVKACPVPRS